MYLKQVYYQIKIKKGNKQKATFKLKEGLYKLLIMQFRLINALAIFQKQINRNGELSLIKIH